MHTIRDMKLTTPISSASTVDPHAIRNERIGTLLMVFGGIVLGTIGIFIEEAGQDPVTTVLFRCGFGGVALLLWGLMEGRIAELRLTGRALRSAIAAGLLMVVNWGLFLPPFPGPRLPWPPSSSTCNRSGSSRWAHGCCESAFPRNVPPRR